MPRKRKTPVTPSTDAFARGLADTMRPMIKELVREAFSELLGDWMAKNAPKLGTPDDISRLGPNGAPKREG